MEYVDPVHHVQRGQDRPARRRWWTCYDKSGLFGCDVSGAESGYTKVNPLFQDSIDSIPGATRALLRQCFSRSAGARSKDLDGTESVCLSR